MIEAETETPKILGGNGRKTKRGESPLTGKRLKYTPVGYIRAKKVSGKRYYYYCEAVRQPDGEFKEQCEYLGTARAVLVAVRQAR